MFDKTLKTILLLSPLVYMHGLTLDQLDLMLFPVYISVLVIAAIASKPQRVIEMKPLAFILAFGLANLMLHGFHRIILSSYLNLFFGILGICLIAGYTKDWRSCSKYLVWAGIINILALVAQCYGIGPLATTSGEPGGVMGNAPRLVAYLAITMPFLLQKPFSWITIVYLAVGVIMKEFLIVPIFAMLFDWRRAGKWIKYAAPIAALIILSIYYKPIIQSFSIRWPIWEPTLGQIFEKPIIGYGLGMFPNISQQFIEGNYHADTAFSSMLQFIFAMGLVMTTVFVGFLYNFYKKLRLSNLEDFSVISGLAVLAVLIMSTVEYPFQIPRLWMAICFIFATFLITYQTKEIKNV